MFYYYLRFEAETTDGCWFTNRQGATFLVRHPPAMIGKLVSPGQCVLVKGRPGASIEHLEIDSVICNTGSVDAPFTGNFLHQHLSSRVVTVVWETLNTIVRASVTLNLASLSSEARKKKPATNDAGLVVWRVDGSPQWMTLPLERLLHVGGLS